MKLGDAAVAAEPYDLLARNEFGVAAFTAHVSLRLVFLRTFRAAALVVTAQPITRVSRMPLPVQVLDLDVLSRTAAHEDQGLSGIAPSVRHLAEAGWLGAAPLPTGVLFDRLVALGEVNLPLARLHEGHVNALRLAATLGDSSLRAEVWALADAGALLGVWGAEGEVPLGVEEGRLVGGKRFASGLGTVSHAVVTVGQGEAVRLALLDVSDPARHRPATWCKTGMRATVSGDFDAAGLPASALRWIGRPGRYLEEPGFVGGVWRIAAVQLGGTLGLLRAAADHLRAAGRLEAEAQVARLTPVLTRALAAGAFVRRAAEVAEGPAGLAEPERAVSLSAQARLLTEEVGQDAIAAVERSVGLAHFDEDAPSGRIARDLATYMRQAARDAFLQRAGAWALRRPGAFSALLGDPVAPEAPHA